jgi:3-oxoacyl-[acyl-carrier protein] reductase
MLKHVIVTGASRGLGLAIVRVLLAEDYMVSVCSRAKTAEISELESRHPRFKWFCAEVGNELQCNQFVEAACQWAGDVPLWGLVNNAGIAMEGVLATFPNIDADNVLQVNLHGALYMARAALRVMLRQRGAGRIINISSIIAQRGYTGLAAYSASKAGMDGLTRALARENGRRGITVNSVAPGYLDTEMSATLEPAKREQIVRRTPLGRLGTVDDVTPLICFLLSEQASFITGQILTVDGGITN